MFQTIMLLGLSFLAKSPAVESPTWTDVLGHWMSDRLSSASMGSKSEHVNAAGNTVAPEVDSEVASEVEPLLDESPLAKHAGHEDERLEAIEESRPDDLDEFAEASSRLEKAVDSEELTEATGELLSDDGEIDWTTQAD
jgi:hypothetical protein